MRKVTVDPTYSIIMLHLCHTACNNVTIIILGYVDDLVQKTVELRQIAYRPPSSEAPESLCSGYERPEKSVAISSHKTRFSL